MTGSIPSAEAGHPLLSTLPPHRAKKGKVVTSGEAARVIRDGDTLATGGFVGIGFAEEIAVRLEARFLKTGRPRNLTLVYAAGQGDGGEKGLNHLGHDGLVSRVIGGHWGLVPRLQELAVENKIEAYTDMVKYLVDRYYSGVSRYTTSAFLRMKPGDALKRRSVAPYTYESREEAREALERKP